MEKDTEKSVKNRIVDAAWQLFYEKGYQGTTVDDIIRLSDTSKGSFYYYFKTKDELLDTLSILLDELYEKLDDELYGSDSPNKNDKSCFDRLLYINCEAHRLMEEKISVELLASLYSTQLVTSGQRRLLDQNRTYYKLVKKILEEGQKNGEIRSDLSVSEITQYYSMCERALVYDWCLNEGGYSLTEQSLKWMPIMLEYLKK
jgi:AcrR family transcriptional regulator